jgi:hypothetical protein
LFDGFDSRLTITPIGEFSIKSDAVVGFEVVHDRPVVALPHRVLALTKSGTLGWTSLDKVNAIAVDGNDRLLVQTTKAVLTPGQSKAFAAVGDLSKVARGELYDSGNPNMLSLTKENSGRSTITAIRPNADEGSSLQLENAVRALSWNPSGMSMIVGNALLVSPAGTSKPSLLAADKGFEKAQDSCLAGQDRAVVAMPDMVVLITKETATLIVGISARVRCNGDTLYLLDLRTGVVAKVTGLDKIGHKSADEDYAKSLLLSLPPHTPENDPKFLEAARIIGCTRAQSIVGPKVVTSTR